MRANGNFSFGTKPKQMSFGNRSTGAKQMRANWNYSFGTKPKQMAFGNWSAGTKQMRANGILTFGTKPKQSKWQKPTTKWTLGVSHICVDFLSSSDNDAELLCKVRANCLAQNLYSETSKGK